MNNMTLPADKQPVQCAKCGVYYHHTANVCPRCGTHHQEMVSTTALPASASKPTTDRSARKIFGTRTSAMLEFAPMGAWVSLALDRPMVLGRGGLHQANEELLDLTDFDALKKGVSRRHCQLRRHSHRLIVIDLGSANGTYVNGHLLPAHEPYPLAHGDQLLLGALRCNVFFNAG